ncbi:hypothetical protein FI667_g6387, partial [Globisporangium splendens]
MQQHQERMIVEISVSRSSFIEGCNDVWVSAYNPKTSFIQEVFLEWPQWKLLDSLRARLPDDLPMLLAVEKRDCSATNATTQSAWSLRMNKPLVMRNVLVLVDSEEKPISTPVSEEDDAVDRHFLLADCVYEQQNLMHCALARLCSESSNFLGTSEEERSGVLEFRC